MCGAPVFLCATQQEQRVPGRKLVFQSPHLAPGPGVASSSNPAFSSSVPFALLNLGASLLSVTAFALDDESGVMVVAGEAAPGVVPGAGPGATAARAWRVLDGYPYYTELFGGDGAPGGDPSSRPPAGLGQAAQHTLSPSTLLNPLLLAANARCGVLGQGLRAGAGAGGGLCAVGAPG